MKSYSSQLAFIHIEYYLHQLLRSIPELNELSETAPVTGIDEWMNPYMDGWMDGWMTVHQSNIYLTSQGYIPDTPPGSMDFYTQGLRDCISVLFMFERKPQRDSQFSVECRHWLNTMVSVLLYGHIMYSQTYCNNNLLNVYILPEMYVYFCHKIILVSNGFI